MSSRAVATATTSVDEKLVGLWLALAGTTLLLARGQLLGLAGERIVVLVVLYLAVGTIGILPRIGAGSTAVLPQWLVTVIGMAGVAAVTFGPPGRVDHAAGTVAVLLGVGAAIAEEAFFRRFLYDRLTSWSEAAAVVGSALAFALVHVPLYGTSVFFLDLGAGLLLSWQRYASGRWAPSAATHAFANVMAAIR